MSKKKSINLDSAETCGLSGFSTFGLFSKVIKPFKLDAPIYKAYFILYYGDAVSCICNDLSKIIEYIDPSIMIGVYIYRYLHNEPIDNKPVYKLLKFFDYGKKS